MITPTKTLSQADIHKINDIRWWHRIPVGLLRGGSVLYTPGEVYHGADGSNYASEEFGLPSDLTGKSVLDIGGWDGYFSFEAESRGAAEVIVADVPLEQGGNWGGTAGFQCARKLLGSKLTRPSVLNIEDNRNWAMSSSFDVVLFYGVLYHLRNPIAAIQNLASLCKPGALVLTETAGFASKPELAFYLQPGHDNDKTNLWYPTLAGYKALCENYGFGFKDVKLVRDRGGSRFCCSMVKA